MVGAGGGALAALLGERLGWPVFDRAILNVMAGDDAMRRQIYASMDERNVNLFEEALRTFTEKAFIKNDYFHQLARTVLSLAHQSPGVFLGRGSNLILPRHLGLRVRLVASKETRARNFAERHGLTVARAAREIESLEKERAKFVRHHFGLDINDSTRYDLTINLDMFSTEEAVNLILQARTGIRLSRAAKKAPGRTPAHPN
jgi:cytidylate kinase